MVYQSKLNDYVEYDVRRKGITIRSLENGEETFLDCKTLDKDLRQLKPEVIGEMVGMIKQISVGKCIECGKEFYSLSPRRQYCSYECRYVRILDRSRGHREREKELELELTEEMQSEPQRKSTLEDTNEKARAQGLSYGKYKARAYAEEFARVKI